MRKTAVVLFNLGGPDSLKAVRPFLFNLFADPAIIRLPKAFRLLLAWLISTRRKKVAQHIYAQMGGKSPILPQTQAQAEALEKKLKQSGDYKVFIAMRYWHPFSRAVVREVQSYDPDEIILLPLYPQFSTTTTASSLKDWERSAKNSGLKAKISAICCYPTQNHFILAHAELLRGAVAQAAAHGPVRILFSAHGLPEKFIADGDPYAWQVEQTVSAILNEAKIENAEHVICYQSRVGRLVWIGPATDEEIIRAARDGKALVVVPVAFVSEHSETLVELDLEYAKLAGDHGARTYIRVPALGVQPDFIESLAAMCKAAPAHCAVASYTGTRLCPARFTGCPMKEKLP